MRRANERAYVRPVGDSMTALLAAYVVALLVWAAIDHWRNRAHYKALDRAYFGGQS